MRNLRPGVTALEELRSFAMYDDPYLLPNDFCIVEASKAASSDDNLCELYEHDHGAGPLAILPVPSGEVRLCFFSTRCGL